MSAVAAIRAKADDYKLRSLAEDDAFQAHVAWPKLLAGDTSFLVDHKHELTAVAFATVAIALYEIAEALEQDGDE